MMMHVMCVVQTEWGYYDATNMGQNRHIRRELSTLPPTFPTLLREEESEVLWAPQGHQQVCGRGGILVWILIIPPSMLFPIPQTSSSLPSEAASVLISTKDPLPGVNLSSPFGEVHSNSGGL